MGAVLGLGLSLALGSGSAAHAEDLPTRSVGVVPRGGALTIDVAIPDVFTPEARQRLLSGFATRVLVRVYLQEAGISKAIAVAVERVEIVYDIWDEKFQLRLSHGPGTEREIEVATLGQAVEAATSLRQFPVAPLDLLVPGHRYSIAIRSDLNPLSQELLAELRQWLRQPSGPQRRPGTGGGDSFFGTFVTVFINPQIDESEHQVRFVSPPFVSPPFVSPPFVSPPFVSRPPVSPPSASPARP